MTEFSTSPEAQEPPFDPKFQVETKGFKEYEIWKINAGSLFDAYEQIGRRTKYVNEILLEYQKEDEYDKELKYPTKSLEELIRLSKTGAFTTSDGLNHLSRYLEALGGFAKGCNLTMPEIAFLQMINVAGCQTLVVSNKKSGEIVAVHTEEDKEQYKETKNASSGKYWLKLTLPDQIVEYCAYEGLCGYGYASGIIQRDGQAIFQATDMLGPTENGPIWANAFAFMLMDCASINFANELISKVTSFFPKNESIFNGGYIIHQIETGNPPKMQSLEFGGKCIVRLLPKTSGNREFQLGVNYPQDPELQKIDEYDLSEDDCQAEKKMMIKRQRRLEKIAGLVGRTQETAVWGEQQALKLIHRVIQKGRGDVLGEWFTGLSNKFVAQSTSIYVSPKEKLRLIVRRGYSKANRKMKL